MSKMEINKEVLLERAKKSYANITELADVLVRKEEISFRQSHEIVSTFIKKENKEDVRELNYVVLQDIFKEKIQKEMTLTEKEFSNSLSPTHFVQSRKIEGSPAKEIMKKALQISKKELSTQRKEKDEKMKKILQKEHEMWHYII